jgi:hypothetical protein
MAHPFDICHLFVSFINQEILHSTNNILFIGIVNGMIFARICLITNQLFIINLINKTV